MCFTSTEELNVIKVKSPKVLRSGKRVTRKGNQQVTGHDESFEDFKSLSLQTRKTDGQIIKHIIKIKRINQEKQSQV